MLSADCDCPQNYRCSVRENLIFYPHQLTTSLTKLMNLLGVYLFIRTIYEFKNSSTVARFSVSPWGQKFNPKFLIPFPLWPNISFQATWIIIGQWSLAWLGSMHVDNACIKRLIEEITENLKFHYDGRPQLRFNIRVEMWYDNFLHLLFNISNN